MDYMRSQYLQGQEDYKAGKIDIFKQLKIEETILFNYHPEKWAYASGWRSEAIKDGWVFDNNSAIRL